MQKWNLYAKALFHNVAEVFAELQMADSSLQVTTELYYLCRLGGICEDLISANLSRNGEELIANDSGSSKASTHF